MQEKQDWTFFLLVFLKKKQNKFFTNEYRKSGDSSVFFAMKDTSRSRGLARSSCTPAWRKISDVLRVSSTIYALLSGVNNNQPFPLLLKEEGEGTKLISLIFPLLSSPSLGLRPTLSSITSGRFVSVTSAPRYRSEIPLLACAIFLLVCPAFLFNPRVGALAASAAATREPTSA